MTKVIFDDNAPNVAATIIILTTLSLIVFPMRVYTRVKGNAWGWDDWSMTFALIPFTALSVFCLGGSFLGIGVHKWKLTAAQNETGMMVSLVIPYQRFIELTHTTVVLLLRMLLLPCDYSHQAQYIFHAYESRWAEEELHLRAMGDVLSFRHHEPDQLLLHRLSL